MPLRNGCVLAYQNQELMLYTLETMSALVGSGLEFFASPSAMELDDHAEPENEYDVAAVSANLASGAPIDSNAVDLTSFLPTDIVSAFEQRWYKPLQENPANLSVEKCLSHYSQPFSFKYDSLALVMDWNESNISRPSAMTFQRNSRDGVLYPGWPCGIEADYLDLPHVPGADSCNLKKLVKSKASYYIPFHRDNEGQGLSGKYPVPAKYSLAHHKHSATVISD